MSTESCIYEGWTKHCRRQPIAHEFTYRLYMMYLDLDELPTLFDPYLLWSHDRTNIACMTREDHLGPAEKPLDAAVRDLVELRMGTRPSGPIRMLTHLRYFGHRFNPVSFYYCFESSGTRPDFIIAEINNTPWGEQHCYVLPVDTAEDIIRIPRFHKQFHISPFMPMDQGYDWVFSRPGHDLRVRMRSVQEGTPVLDVDLQMQRTEICARTLTSVLLRYPFMTLSVIRAIYTQALRLYLKGIPFHAHPRSRASETGEFPAPRNAIQLSEPEP